MNKKEKKDIPEELKYPPEEDIYNKGIRAEKKIVDENTDFETGYKGPDSIEELISEKTIKPGGWMYPEQSRMIYQKKLERRMKKIIITAWVATITKT